MTVVLGYGPSPSRYMIVGEAPGANEADQGRPFVGASGAEQAFYLKLGGMKTADFYMTNVVKAYLPGNPDPTPQLIREWTPSLEREIKEVKPEYILSVGRFATRWFLGDVDMEMTHGIPHQSPRAPNATILPCYHPAFGLYDGDAKALVAYDYSRACAVMKGESTREGPVDEWAGKEQYLDVDGGQFAVDLAPSWVGEIPVLGLDTEGTPADPWSIQVSANAGSGVVLRRSRQDFEFGIASLQSLVDNGTLVVLHNGMYDIEMARMIGLNLSDANLWDTMYAAYLMRLEPQGLKPLAYRHCGMRMNSYTDTVGNVGREKQLDYLAKVMETSWPKPEPRVVVANDGQARLYKPQPISQRVEKILLDCYSGKVDKDGDSTDPHERWKQVDKELRLEVERLLGPMPVGTLDDIPLDQAVAYSGRDPDATLRLYYKLKPEIERLGMGELMQTGMEVLPVFESMQSTGLPASRQAFEKLRDEMSEGMERLQVKISHEYFNDRPFNPKSPLHVATILRRRGLEPAKRTSTGAISTGKASIEHLRYVDEAIDDIFTWREHQQTRDVFCEPALELMPSGQDFAPMRCRLKTTRTTTRRLASADPNLLAISKHSDYGKRIRSCYQCLPGQVFGEWDYSQIESRLLAHESQDELLCKLFEEGRDIHAETAARLFNVPLSEVTKIQRFFAKRINFGVPYGFSESGMATQLRVMGITGWDERACGKFMREYGRIYKGVTAYIQRVESESSKTGTVRDCWGMMRYLPGVWSSDKKIAAEARRQAVNHRIQGAAQGCIQNAMIALKPEIRRLQLEGKQVWWSLQLHDALMLRFDEELWDELDSLMKEKMVSGCGLKMRVPMLVDGKKARTWGDL